MFFPFGVAILNFLYFQIKKKIPLFQEEINYHKNVMGRIYLTVLLSIWVDK